MVDREKNTIGDAYNQEAPNGTFINCSLKGYWIISDEEYKQLKGFKIRHEKDKNK